MTMFEGFSHRRVATGAAEIDLVTAGDGPPVLLLHGFPQTRAAWAAVAPMLARDFTVVVPDLRGYGRSTGPAPAPDGATHAKRAMAADMVAVMATLGHERFHVAGHDRGGRVAYRLALDAPGRVMRLALLDIMTTLDTWEAMDWRAALAAYHWPFLAQRAEFVEAMIGRDPGHYLDHLLDRWIGKGARLPAEALADYHTAMRDPAVVAAMAADYRAGAGIDRDLDAADRDAGRRLAGPLLVLRGSQYEPRALAPAWGRWCETVEEVVFDCGHFIAEEVPEACAAALSRHFSAIV